MSQSNTVTVKAETSPAPAAENTAPITVRNISRIPIPLKSKDGKDSITIQPNTTTRIKGIFKDDVIKNRSLRIV